MSEKPAMRCRACKGKLNMKIGWRGVSLRCMECSRVYSIDEYLHELDAKAWEKLAHRSCDRA